MDFLFFILGVFAGGLIVYFYFQSRMNDKNQLLFAEKEKRIKIEAEFNAQKSVTENTVVQFRETFSSLASVALNQNNKAFVEYAQQVFEKMLIRAGDDLDKKRDNIEQILKPLKENIEKHEVYIREVELNNSKTFGSLRNYLDTLQVNQKNLEKETSALVSALKAPKIRGRWGEIGLRRIVEFSGMSSYCDFQEQVNLESSDGVLRPDMVVSLPGERKIVVDSKVPLNAYLDAIETDNDETRKILMQKHSKAVQQHIKNLASKNYWSQFDNSVDFVVMYMEVEPAFGAALTENSGLFAEALQNRIVLATPSTLIALLQTVSYNWKQHAAIENLQTILSSVRELYERMATFSEHFTKLGGDINSLVKSFNQSIGSWESRVLPGFRKVEEMGAASEKKKILDISVLDVTARNS